METITGVAVRRIVYPEDAAITQVVSVPVRGNHAAAIGIAVDYAGWDTPIKSQEQGFVTSEGRFVDRKEAFRVATHAGQVESDHCRLKGELDSTDILLDRHVVQEIQNGHPERAGYKGPIHSLRLQRDMEQYAHKLTIAVMRTIDADLQKLIDATGQLDVKTALAWITSKRGEVT